MNVFKGMVALLWLWGLLSFLVAPDSAFSVMGRFLFWILAVLHAIECLLFLPRLRAAEGSLAGHLVQTFVFGVAHVRGLPQGDEARPG